MADILIHSTVPSLFTHTESASNLIVDNQTTDTQTNNSNNNNKYNGHVTRLRNVFTDQTLNSNEHLKHQSTMNTQRKYSNSDQHYDFPADAIEQFKKLQREDSDIQIMPAFLPSNIIKRMNHLNTTFVKPTKIEANLPKYSFHEQDEQTISNESFLIDEPDYVHDDVDPSSSPIFYETEGLPKLEDGDEDDSLNDVRRVRFSTAPLRVYPAYSPNEYDRRNPDIDPFAAAAEYELEKRIEKMDVFTIDIEKGPDGLGISILGMGVGADSGLEKLGIFVKTMNPDGIIGKDGRIQIGDQIIEVDGQSLVGVTHVYATNVLKNTSGLVRFVIGREKDFSKSEILGLIQRSLQLDKEREEMSRTFQQYQNAYYEKIFNENNDEVIDDEDDDSRHQQQKQKLTNDFEIEILKQCYESLEKTLDNTEKEKENYQKLYEQTLNDFRELEEKYVQAKVLIQQLQDREIDVNEKHEKKVNDLLKRIEELEKIISISTSTSQINRNTPATIRLPSLSLEKISAHSQLDSWHVPQLYLATNQHTNKSVDQLDQNFLANRTKLPLKHLSTPSLGDISNDSDLASAKTQIPLLDQTNNDHYVEIKDWTTDQCIQWLTAQQMTSYIPIFLNRSIDGEKLLVLDSSKMKAIGIKSSKDRDQLKSRIKELKHTELNRLRERLLNQSSSSSSNAISKRIRSSSLSRLRERRFFSSGK